MKLILLDKEISKDFLQGLAYYMFIAGMARFAVPAMQASSTASKIIFILFFLFLLWFVSAYTLLHIVRPIVKLYHRDFTLPDIDPEHSTKANWKNVVLTKSFLLMSILFFTALYIGWFLVQVSLFSQTPYNEAGLKI